MENTNHIRCYHLMRLEEANETVQKLVQRGELQIDKNCGFCDHRVPGEIELVVGQDITCVGPASPLCPDPASATVV